MTPAQHWFDLPIVCARRLGAAMNAARVRHGMTVGQVAATGSYWWLPSELEMIERGNRTLRDDQLIELAALYGLRHPPSPIAAFDFHVDRTITDQHVFIERTGLDRLAIEVFGRPPRTDLEDAMARFVAVVNAAGLTDRPRERGQERVQAGLNGFAEVLGCSSRDAQDGYFRVRRSDSPLVAELTEELKQRVAVPIAGLLVVRGAGGSLFMSQPKGRRSDADGDGAPAAARLGTLGSMVLDLGNGGDTGIMA